MIVLVLYCPYCWEIPEATLRQTNHYRICNNESRSMLACTSHSAIKNCKIYNLPRSNYSDVRLIFWANKCANVQKKFNTYEIQHVDL